MTETVKIVLSPVTPNVGVAFGITLSIKPPYSDKGITLHVNQNIADYQAQPTSPGFSQLMVDSGGGIQKAIDFASNNSFSFLHGGNSYGIKLLRCGKEKLAGQTQEFFSAEILVEEMPPTTQQNEGTAIFRLSHEHEDWGTNVKKYDFGSKSGNGIVYEAMKLPDKTIHVMISGPFCLNFHLSAPVPTPATKVVEAAITWGEDEVNLYLNGQPVQTLKKSECLEKRS